MAFISNFVVKNNFANIVFQIHALSISTSMQVDKKAGAFFDQKSAPSISLMNIINYFMQHDKNQKLRLVKLTLHD